MKFSIIKTMKYAAAGMLCALYCAPAFAADSNHDLLTMEAAENIRFSSQAITKAYFYKQQSVRPDHAAEVLKKKSRPSEERPDYHPGRAEERGQGRNKHSGLSRIYPG